MAMSSLGASPGGVGSLCPVRQRSRLRPKRALRSDGLGRLGSINAAARLAASPLIEKITTPSLSKPLSGQSRNVPQARGIMHACEEFPKPPRSCCRHAALQ